MEKLLIVPIITMAAYLMYMFSRYGMTATISATAKKHRYWWEKAWFMATLTLGVALPVIVYALEITQGNSFQFLWFLAGAGISFVGAAQVYWKGKMQHDVHMAGSYAGIILGVVASLVTLFSFVTIIIVVAFAAFFLLPGKIGIKIHNHTYWVEVAAILTVCLTLFLH